MMKEDNRNLLLAIVMSVVVLLGWQFFYGVPQMEKQKQIAQQNQQAQSQSAPAGASNPAATAAPPGQPAGSAAPGSAPGAASTQVSGTREQALAASPRIKIDTPKIAGSISLAGARIDDVSLKAYHETVDPKSPIIVLLSPAGGPNAYYSDFGWVAAPGNNVAVPNATTLWTADSQTLTPAKPVTLSWDNGQGLTFKRVISVDDNAMFAIRDEVENKGGAPVTLFPYGQVVRQGKPHTLGYYVLHEGLVGYLGEQSGLQELTYDKLDKEGALSPGTVGKVWKDAVGGFVGITDKYWAAAVIPDQQRKYEGRFSSVETGTQRTYQADFLGEGITVAPGANTASQARLFAGAKEVAAINGYEESQQIKRFDLLIDWGWFYFFTKPLFFVLDWIYKHVGNFGVAILIVTVLLKGLFFPLANKSYASMAKMKALQPEMTAIREGIRTLAAQISTLVGLLQPPGAAGASPAPDATAAGAAPAAPASASNALGPALQPSAGVIYTRAFGDYMSNPGADTNNHGYFAGVAFGKAGKKGTWDFTYRYRVIQSDAWYEELADSDSGAFYQAAPAGGASGYGGGTNVRGHIFQGNYALNDAALVGFTYFATRLINPSPAGSESGMGRLQVNTILKF